MQNIMKFKVEHNKTVNLEKRSNHDYPNPKNVKPEQTSFLLRIVFNFRIS